MLVMILYYEAYLAGKKIIENSLMRGKYGGRQKPHLDPNKDDNGFNKQVTDLLVMVRKHTKKAIAVGPYI